MVSDFSNSSNITWKITSTDNTSGDKMIYVPSVSTHITYWKLYPSEFTKTIDELLKKKVISLKRRLRPVDKEMLG